MLSETEKVWLACALDCDGHIGMKLQRQVQKGKEYEYVLPQFGFSNTSHPMASRFGELINQKVHSMKEGKPYEDKRISRCATHNTKKIHDLLEQIMPYIIAKRKRAVYVLAFCKHKLKTPGNHGKGKSDRLVEDLKWLVKYQELYPRHRRNRTENPP